MKIKSANYFRQKYHTDIRGFKEGSGYDVDYIGSSHTLSTGERVKGFFDLYHGDKESIEGLLSTFLKIAEDGQAIYEFLQNAADCGSSLFYLFYDEKYLIAVNNGEAFNQKGLRSILNISQSVKQSASEIGRFGIGFKLVHRLVGKGDGKDELVKDLKGPIMFSWSKKIDLLSLMNGENIEAVDNISDDSDLPYLLKLILTNFPAGPNETVKNLQYEDTVLFTQEEYLEMGSKIKEYLSPHLEQDDFNQGSIFFIRLGEGKKELLDKDYEENFKTGVEYSLNTLKGLKNVKVNSNQLVEVPLKMEKGEIAQESEEFIRISPEYKDAPIHYAFGYDQIDFNSENPFAGVERLKVSPTFYKYFPLGDETHNSAIFVHCDSISNQANRRKLQDDSVNKELLPEIAKFIIKKLDEYKDVNNRTAYLQLFSSILLCGNVPSNSAWVNQYFYNALLEHIKVNVPTTNGYCDNSSFVKIRRLKCNIPLAIANDKYCWFEWNADIDSLKPIFDAAKTKLGIKEYGIVDFIKDADTEKLNLWIQNADAETYTGFMTELNSHSLLDVSSKIKSIKLFKFSDGSFYSYDDIITSQYNYTYRRTDYLYKTDSVCLFSSSKTENIQQELKTIGFVVSESNLDKYTNIKVRFNMPTDAHVFERISNKLNPNNLSLAEKKKLILHFATTDSTIKFEGIGESSIKGLCLCRNNNGEYVKLGNMLSRSYVVPSWLSAFQICTEDYFSELDTYLIQEKNIYHDVVFEKWDEIKPTEGVDLFYQKVKSLYDLDAEHNKSLTGKKYIFGESGDYVDTSYLFYNDCLASISSKYACLQNAMTTLFGMTLPQKSILSYLNEAPFVTSQKSLCNLSLKSEAGEVDKDDIVSILQLCALHKETFFTSFVIVNTDNGYKLCAHGNDCYQVYSQSKTTREFIEKNCAGTMYLLPDDFDDYKKSEGIVSGEDLHSALLTYIEDVDEHKGILIDIVKGESRAQFVKKLSSVTIDLNKTTDTESFEFKILDLASKVLKKDECRAFYEKMIIIKGTDEYTYKDIPDTVADKFTVEGGKQPFELSSILPNENQNAAIVNEVVDKFTKLGADRDKLKALLGITSEADVNAILKNVQDNYPVLQNAQQLAFVLLMFSKESKSSSSIKVINAEGKEDFGLFYLVDKPFISKNYLLDGKYAGIEKFMEIPTSGSFVKLPLISEGKFNTKGICTKGEDEKYDYQKVISLLDYLRSLYLSNKEAFANVNWNDYSNELGFSPKCCIYPCIYALENEKLPSEVENWCKIDAQNLATMEAMGVLIDSSTIVTVRKHFVSTSNDIIDAGKVSACDNKMFLQNTLEWLNTNTSFPLTEENYSIVETIVNRINTLRGNAAGIKISDTFDIELLNDESIQYGEDGYKEWKEESNISIYLYDGTLPKMISLNEYINHVVYRYVDADICDNGSDIIYANKAGELQKLLHLHAANNNIGLTTELVYKLFNRNISDLQKEIMKLKKENECLRNNLPVPKDDVDMKSNSRNDVDSDERPEYNEVARKKVKRLLEAQGYLFTQGIGEFSIIPGVFDPEGNNRPLVVKSCKWGRLYISPMEWGVLLRPDAMLWVFDGRDVTPLHLRSLIMGQDKLVLTMDTTNLDDIDKVSKCAQILQFFKQVNFEFNSVKPSTIASTYKEYAFDDRPQDEKLTSDEFE